MILETCKYFEGTGNFCSRVTAMRCDEFPECEFKYVAKLKAENERLKRELSGKRFICPQCMEFAKEIHKYKQTLQEIKKIAENVCRDDCPDLKNGYCIGLGECSFRARKQIIDLITKAEEE